MSVIGEQTRHQPVQVQHARCCKAQPDRWQLHLGMLHYPCKHMMKAVSLSSSKSGPENHNGIEYVALQ